MDITLHGSSNIAYRKKEREEFRELFQGMYKFCSTWRDSLQSAVGLEQNKTSTNIRTNNGPRAHT